MAAGLPGANDAARAGASSSKSSGPGQGRRALHGARSAEHFPANRYSVRWKMFQ
jgi:hypothetical protein